MLVQEFLHILEKYSEILKKGNAFYEPAISASFFYLNFEVNLPTNQYRKYKIQISFSWYFTVKNFTLEWKNIEKSVFLCGGNPRLKKEVFNNLNRIIFKNVLLNFLKNAMGRKIVIGCRFLKMKVN